MKQISFDFLMSLFESMNDGISILDDQGVHLAVNPAMCRLTGFSEEELLGSGFPHPYWPPEDYDRIRDAFSNTIRGDVSSFELTFMRKTGGRFPILMSPFSIRNEQGQVISYSATVKDITAIKQAETIRRESENVFRIIFDQSPVGSVMVGMDKRFIRCNAAFCHFLGYTEEELIGKTISEITYPEDADIGMSELKKLVSQEIQNAGFRKRYLRKDGKVVWGEIRISVVADSHGKPAYFLPVIQDITRQIEIEKAELAVREALEKSEQNAHALLNALPDMMFRLTRSGVFIDYKASREDLYYQQNSIIGKDFHDIMPSGLLNMFDEYISLAIQTGNLQEFEYQLPHPSGETRVYEGRMVANGPDEVITIVRDISDLKTTEKTLRDSQQKLIRYTEELRELNATKDKFFSIIAHDLRSPFNAFLGFTELMVNEIETMSLKDLQRIAASMRKSATHLFRLLDNLLNWSRLQREAIAFSPHELNLSSIVADSLQYAGEFAAAKQIEIRFDIPDGRVVIADENMLGSILRNLTCNAVKFTRSGGTVLIKATLLPGITEISVTDNGIGMNGHQIDQLFHLNGATNRQGTEGEPSAGLGLILCREFIEKHGGTLRIVSVVEDQLAGKPGMSTFSFTLPS
jgi:PAS domain S-box-containing protein